MALDDNERRILYRNLINDPATQSETRKYSFTDWEKKLLSDEKAIGKLAQFSVGRNWAIDENDFAERFVPELKAPPTPKPKPVPAPAQQFPVGIAAPESIKGAAPSVTDIGREMAFKPAVQQPIEPVEPVEPIGVMAPEPIVEPAPSVTEVAREMAFKPPVQPKMPKEEEMSPLETAGQKVMEFASGFNRALFKAPSSVVKTASELGVGVINMLGGDMQSEDAVLYSLADKYDKWLDTSEVAKKWIGKPEYTGLVTDVGSGLGQIASMVAAGPQGASQALLKTPTVLKAVSQQMFSKPSLIAFSQVFNSEFENMKAKGESEQTAFNQGLTNALATSPLENLPLINLAERLNKTIGVKLARRVLNALQQGAEEGGQEAVQQVFSNLTNNQLVESEQNIVDWAQGIQPSAEAGGVVGLLIGGLANAKAARGYSKTSGLDKFSDNVVNNEIIQNAARDYQDNISKAEQQGKKPDSFNQKQLKKISENPEAWVRDEIKYIQQTIESNKTLGLDSKVEENSLAKATALLNQIKAEKKGMEEAALAPAQEAVPVAPEAEVIAPEGGAPMPQKVKVLGKDVNMYNDYIPSRPEDVEPDAMYIFNADSRDGIPPLLQDVAYANKRESNGVKTENWHASISGEDLLNLYPQTAASPNLIAAPEAAPVAEDIPFEEVPAETDDELAFLDEMRLTPEEEAAPVAPAEEVIPEVAPAAPAPKGRKKAVPEKEEVAPPTNETESPVSVKLNLKNKNVDYSYTYQGDKFERKKNEYEDSEGNKWLSLTQDPKKQYIASRIGRLFAPVGDVKMVDKKKGLFSKGVEFVSKHISSQVKNSNYADFLADRVLLEKVLGDRDRDNPSNTFVKKDGDNVTYGFFDFGNTNLSHGEVSTKSIDEAGQIGFNRMYDAAEKNGISVEDLNKTIKGKLKELKTKLNNPKFIENLKKEIESIPNKKEESFDVDEIVKNLNERIEKIDKYVSTSLSERLINDAISELKEDDNRAKKRDDYNPWRLNEIENIEKDPLTYLKNKVKENRPDSYFWVGNSLAEYKKAIEELETPSSKESTAPVKPAPAAPKKEEAPKPEPKKEEGKKELTLEKEKEYEQVQGTGKEARKGKGAPKTERAVRPKVKPVRNAGKSPDAIAARNIIFYSDPVATSLQYLMDATYHPDLLERIFGGPSKTTKSGRKDISGERKSRIQFLDKASNIKTADKLGEYLAEKYAEENNIDVSDAADKHDFTSIAEDIVSSYSSRSQMVRELLRLNEQQDEAFEFLYNPEEIYGKGYNEDIAKEIDNIMGELPDSYWEGKEITGEEFSNLFAEETEPETKEGKKAEAKEDKGTAPEFTSEQSSEAATAFDKAKTSKGFDKKHGKGAYKALSDITKNFEDIMDKVSDKIKQDCL